jgi:hypothetical protein
MMMAFIKRHPILPSPIQPTPSIFFHVSLPTRHLCSANTQFRYTSVVTRGSYQPLSKPHSYRKGANCHSPSPSSANSLSFALKASLMRSASLCNISLRSIFALSLSLCWSLAFPATLATGLGEYPPPLSAGLGTVG